MAKLLLRQRHQWFVTALGQIEGAREEIAQQVLKETDLGKELGIRTGSRGASQDAHASQPAQAGGGVADQVETWQDKMSRSEAHGEELKLAPLCKINALRMLMAGKLLAGKANE